MTLDQVAMTDLANAILARVLGSAGFANASVEQKPDHSGEDALYVTVTFGPGSPAMTGILATDAMLELVRALEQLGDHRFPYLIYDYPDDDRPYEADLDAAE